MLNALIRTAMFLCFVALPIGALAQHQVATGTGIVCDTPEQVARFVLSDERDATLTAINAESHNACAILSVAFMVGETGPTVMKPDGSWRVTKILIVGVDVGNGIQEIAPTVQWTAFQVEEKGA